MEKLVSIEHLRNNGYGVCVRALGGNQLTAAILPATDLEVLVAVEEDGLPLKKGLTPALAHPSGAQVLVKKFI